MSPIAPIARPIRFTAHHQSWQAVVHALGGVLLEEHPGWVVYQLGSGRLALHDASPDHPAGSTALALETATPLPEAVAIAAREGAPITLEQTGHGQAGVLRTVDGMSLTLDALTPGGRSPDEVDSRINVLPIWHSQRTREALDALDALGLKRRSIGESGTWADLRCPGGGVMAVHLSDEPARAELSFEFAGAVQDLSEVLQRASLEPTIVDDNDGRYLRLPDPDGGPEIRINETLTALYGYTLAEM